MPEVVILNEYALEQLDAEILEDINRRRVNLIEQVKSRDIYEAISPAEKDIINEIDLLSRSFLEAKYSQLGLPDIQGRLSTLSRPIYVKTVENNAYGGFSPFTELIQLLYNPNISDMLVFAGVSMHEYSHAIQKRQTKISVNPDYLGHECGLGILDGEGVNIGEAIENGLAILDQIDFMQSISVRDLLPKDVVLHNQALAPNKFRNIQVTYPIAEANTAGYVPELGDYYKYGLIVYSKRPYLLGKRIPELNKVLYRNCFFIIKLCEIVGKFISESETTDDADFFQLGRDFLDRCRYENPQMGIEKIKEIFGENVSPILTAGEAGEGLQNAMKVLLNI